MAKEDPPISDDCGCMGQVASQGLKLPALPRALPQPCLHEPPHVRKFFLGDAEFARLGVDDYTEESHDWRRAFDFLVCYWYTQLV